MSNLTQEESTEDYYSEPPEEIPTPHQTPIKTPLNDSIDSTHDPLDKFKNLMIPLKKDQGAGDDKFHQKYRYNQHSN